MLFIISAPSGSGKSTLVNQIRSLVRDLMFSVSYTTRAPRGSEQQDREYHYISRAQFEEMVKRGEFLEWATVFGNYYGTAAESLAEAKAAGKDLLLDIDVQGAALVRTKIPEAVSIFVLPPNPRILEARLRNRSRAEGHVDEAEIARRSAKARDEIENYREYSYILVNDILEHAVEGLSAIILAERAKHQGGPVDCETARLMQIAKGFRQPAVADRLQTVLASFGLL
jgi:guanylate kinase